MAGVQIALFGGIAAAVLAALSCLMQWVLTQPEITTDAGLLLVHLTGDLGQVARVLKGVHAALVRKWEVLLLRLLLQVLR